MTDPRSSGDPELKAAMQAWDRASPLRDDVFDDAMRIRTELRDTTSHQAYGWAALTCGRIAAHRQQVDLAEVLLTEALGRFYFVGDTYGQNMAVSHLALPCVYRRNLDRALELALRPLSSDVCFSDHDKLLLHNVLSQCYWARDESHAAILHLMKAYDLIKSANDSERKATLLGNLGVVLEKLGEWDLAIAVSTEAWRLQSEDCKDRREMQLTHLSNLVFFNCQLENYEIATGHAEELFKFLKPNTYPATWELYESLVDAFALGGQIEKAKYCLDRAKVLQQDILTPFMKATTQVREAILLEAMKDYPAAIALTKEILDIPLDKASHSNHRSAARVLSRSYAAIGRHAEAARWKQFSTESGREKLLGNILSSQLRTSLRVEQPTPSLTKQEQACLSLSAHGQTSADIALKLGIKTRTVNFHITKVLRKLNATNRQEAIAKAVSANLLQSP